MRQIDRSLAAGVAVVTALVVIVGAAFVYGALAADTSDTAVGPSVSTLDGETTVPDPDGNGTVVGQRDPDEEEGHGRMWYVKSHLEIRMMQMAADCAQTLDVAAPGNETGNGTTGNETGNEASGNTDSGPSEAVCEMLNESYDESLEQYREIDTWSAPSSTPNVRTNPEPFDDLHEESREYENTVTEFQRTYREYREAKAAGDTRRARELGREVRKLSEEVREKGNQTREAFSDTANFTGGDAQRQIGPGVVGSLDEVQENADEIVEEVESGDLVGTSIEASVSEENASFHDPVVVTGRLESANGTVPPNATVVVAPNNRSASTDVEEDGTFRLSYRPTLIPANETSVPVEYVPSNGSAYFGSITSVDLGIERVYPSVTLTSWDSEAGFDDRVRVEGRVTADGSPVPGVPVSIVVSGVELAVEYTAPNGSFAGEGRLPPTITSGERTVGARIRYPDMAIGPANATEPITLRRTDTELTIDASDDGDGAVGVEGRFVTANGTALYGQSIEIQVGDENVTTVRTDPDGEFDGSVSIPESLLPPNGSVRIRTTAAFDGVGTNLGPARASTTVNVTVASDRDDSTASEQPDDRNEAAVVARTWRFLNHNPLVPGALVVATLALLAAAVGIDRPSRSDPQGTTTLDAPDPGTGPDLSRQDRSGSSSALESARERFDDGDHEGCVLLSYSAARRHLPVAIPPGATHWEVYRACRDAGFDDEQLSNLRTATEVFERATFAEGSVSEEEAERALVAVAALVE